MSNYTVKAILRTDKVKKDNTCPIYYRVTINKKCLKLPSGEYAQQDKWNAREGLFKGSKRSYANMCLEQKIDDIKDFIRECEFNKTPATLEKIKEHFTRNKATGFYGILEECFKVKFAEISEGTKEHYKLFKRRLEEYKPYININDLDFNFVNGFDTFLIAKGIGVDGRWKHHKIFKVVINYGIKKKQLPVNPYEDFKVKKGNPKFGYLTEKEILKIKQLTFFNDFEGSGLELTRDMFLFGCYTGLRFSDVSNITKADIVEGSHISIITRKTKKLVNIPLMENMIGLIDKYKSNNSNRKEIFPYRTNQCCNRDLKIIAARCGINKEITFHMSRHSFATNLITGNVNPMLVSQLLGHTNMTQTMIYVNAGTNVIKGQLQNVELFR